MSGRVNVRCFCKSVSVTNSGTWSNMKRVMCSALSGEEGWDCLMGVRWRCIGTIRGWEWSKVSLSSMLSSFFVVGYRFQGVGRGGLQCCCQVMVVVG